MRPDYEIDHVDPKWEEKRDYQLVCGLDDSLNFYERERILNVQKSNRFLPWRVAKDEIGSVPIEQGDLCQFLDRETGEWILEEFMGDWWFNQTRDLCGNSKGAKTCYEQGLGLFSPNLAQQRSETSRKNGISTRDNKRGLFDPKNKQLILDASAKENAKRERPMILIDPQGRSHYFGSLHEAADTHNLSRGNLCSVLKGNRPHTKHYTAHYL